MAVLCQTRKVLVRPAKSMSMNNSYALVYATRYPPSHASEYPGYISLPLPTTHLTLLPYPVIHGYAQTAAIVARNIVGLNNMLSDIATLNYVEGPPVPGTRPTASRPWWILDSMASLEFDSAQSGRWNDTVCRFH
jgi:hypothetical protein